MEQTILQEPLFLLVGELVWEPVPDLGQDFSILVVKEGMVSSSP